MRKTLVYFIILLVLGFGVYYFLFTKHGPDFSQKEAGFNVADTGNIGKIFLAETGGSTILLERTDSGWMVNKEYKVLNSTLNTMLTALHLQKPLYPVPENANDHVIKAMAGDATKVEVYDRDGKKITVFYVGGEVNGIVGTDMLMEGAKRPYVVQIPGFEGYLTSRYAPDIKFWRDRTVFDFSAEQIKSVSVQYPEHPVNSFVMSRDKDSVTVSADPQITNNKNLNVRRSKIYLTYFSKISCEGYFNGLQSGLDTVLKTTPKRCAIEIIATNGRAQHLDIYWMPLNRRSKNATTHAEDVPDDYDADRFFGVMNNYKDTILIQSFVFKKMFRSAFEFYENDIPQPVPRQDKSRNVMMHKNL